MKMIWRRLFEKRKIERDLGEEIEHYITEATEQKIAGGLTREEARRQALIEFGGVEQVKEIMRQSRTGALFETVLRDIRYALRVFLKNPSFSVLAVLTAGLGIAAAASSFSVVDGVLLRPLPYIESDRLVQIWATLPMLRNQPAAAAVWDHFDPGYEGYQQFRQRQRSFDEVAVFSIESASMVQLADPRRINLGTAEASLFRLIGLPALHGRLIQEDDEKPGAPGIAVLGYDSWIKNFGGDPNVMAGGS